jgi:hypothetical protein
MYREMVKSSSHPSPYGYHLIQGYKVGKNRAHGGHQHTKDTGCDREHEF